MFPPEEGEMMDGVFTVDAGLIPIFDRPGRSNMGHAPETAVRIELERRGMESCYVRTKDGSEVDFLARSPEGSEYFRSHYLTFPMIVGWENRHREV